MKRSLGAKTLIYPTPTWVVGSYDKHGKPNGMTAAWGGICCSDPPCVAVSLRKATYSYGSLVNRQAFTISVPSQSQVKLADFLTNRQVLRTVRARLPLLTCEWGIAWVCGQRVDERASVHEATKQVLALRFCLLRT